MTVGELLRSQRRWGRTRSRKFLAALTLNENRELGRLTLRQRQMLAAELEQRHGVRSGLDGTRPIARHRVKAGVSGA